MRDRFIIISTIALATFAILLASTNNVLISLALALFAWATCPAWSIEPTSP